jgi:hypothetical protein
MIKVSKVRAEDTQLLVFDVRPKASAVHNLTKAIVFLGRINEGPPMELLGREFPSYFEWESYWGFNRGRVSTVEDARDKIAFCAKGMYK